MCTMCVPGAYRSEKRGVRSPRTRARDDCDLPHGYWEVSLSPPQEQQGLSTTETSLKNPIVTAFCERVVCLFCEFGLG